MKSTLLIALALWIALPAPALAGDPAAVSADSAAAPLDPEAVFQQEFDAQVQRFRNSSLVEKWVRIENILEVEDGKVSAFEGRFTRPFGLSGVGSICNESSSVPLVQIPGEIRAGSEVVIYCVTQNVGYGGRTTTTFPVAMRSAAALAGTSGAAALAGTSGEAADTGGPVPTVTVGDQVWMSENLRVSTYRNGEAIPEARTRVEWEEAYENERGVWCCYDNDPQNGEKYGKLYNWYAVNDPRGLAPAGWHVPTRQEWQTLVSTSGGLDQAFDALTAADGFGARPCGARYYKDASFNHLGMIGFWWSSTAQDKWNAWYHALHFGYSKVGTDNGGMNTGHSVRCVRDD